jgi:hypothetical protein
VTEIRRGPLPDERDDSPPAPGSYYRNTSGADDGAIPAGDLVLVMSADEEVVSFSYRGGSYTTRFASWVDRYSPAPEGAQERQRELQALLAESQEQAAMRELMATQSPMSLPGTDGVAGDAATGNALVAVNAQAAEALREGMNQLRRRAERVGLSVKERQEKIMLLVKEQELAIRAQAEAAQKMLARSQDTLAALDLYLGTGHSVHMLMDGDPAPASEPFHFHQRVLFMDEETAAATETGGMTGSDMKLFDEWVVQPRNLQRVLPESRGIVAFQVRRTDKRYSDNPLLDWFMNQADGNKNTYLLLRNGERLMRLSTGFEVRDRLMPVRNEWDDLFRDRWSSKPLRPGDPQYRSALEQAGGLQRYYMSVLLLVQGIIDRTEFLKPLPEGGVNLFRVYDDAGPVRFVADAEESLMLPTGRRPWNAWLQAAQDAVQPGMRIVGSFSGWDSGLSKYRRERSAGNERLSPATAEYPLSSEIHTVETRDGHELTFLYSRREEIWDRGAYEMRKPKTRGRCTLEVGDSFWLPLDTVTIEEMQWYLDSRTNRHRYQSMFPLLHQAIAIKQREEAEERPFRELLTGEVLRTLPELDLKQARALVAECVPWYKFTNRTHRALLADDSKALRLIVEEARLRLEREQERSVREKEWHSLVNAALAAEPEALLVAHKRGNEYVVLVPENGENVFVREQTWTTARGRAPAMKSERRWKTVDRRRDRWAIVHTSSRWAGWQVDAVAAEHLTDEERPAVFEKGWGVTQRYARDDRYAGEKRIFVPLAVLLANEQELLFVYRDAEGEVPPPNRLLSEGPKRPGIRMLTVKWRRERGEIKLSRSAYTGASTVEPRGGRFGEEAEVVTRGWLLRSVLLDYMGRPTSRVLVWHDAAAVEAVERRLIEADAARERARVIGAGRSTYLQQAGNAIRQRLEEEAYEAWMAEHGDEGLWPAHRKTLRFDTPPLNRLETCLNRLIEEGVELDGMTVAQVLDEAQAHGVAFADKDRDADVLPMDLVLRRDPETLPVRRPG